MRVARVLEVGVGGPAAGKLDESVPAAGEREFEDQADDSVVVVLDFAREALAGFEDERVERLFDGRTLVANVSGSLFEAGVGSAGSEDVAEDVELNFFADVELDQDEDGTAERRRGGLARLAAGTRGRVGGERGWMIAIHRCDFRLMISDCRFRIEKTSPLRGWGSGSEHPQSSVYCPRKRENGVGRAYVIENTLFDGFFSGYG